MRERTPSQAAQIAVCTVTHNSAAELEGWWTALCALHHEPTEPNFRVIVVDCASDDDSVARLETLHHDQPGPELVLVPATQNLGFAGGMNRAISRTTEDNAWILALNPDARPAPGALESMVRAFTRYRPRTTAVASLADWRVGSVTARLVRPGGQLLDACGMRWTRSWRHLDRGSDEPNDGRFGDPEEVVAGTGAGTMYLREALFDVSFDASRPGGETVRDAPELFAEDFHSFREDAELGLRLQRRGWHCVYEPAAVIEHRRTNTPERRRSMSPSVNRHSLKNRYLLRLWHQRAGNALMTIPAAIRDLGILGYVVLRERESLSAYTWLWRHRRRLLERRRALASAQTTPRSTLDRWFARDGLPLVERSTDEAA